MHKGHHILQSTFEYLIQQSSNKCTDWPQGGTAGFDRRREKLSCSNVRNTPIQNLLVNYIFKASTLCVSSIKALFKLFLITSDK